MKKVYLILTILLIIFTGCTTTTITPNGYRTSGVGLPTYNNYNDISRFIEANMLLGMEMDTIPRIPTGYTNKVTHKTIDSNTSSSGFSNSKTTITPFENGFERNTISNSQSSSHTSSVERSSSSSSSFHFGI
ncbi:hypothetical protein [Cetobacterium sp. SF1]|uniref:hypothetical protein n=1 Tax=unclassified Cetobacterium TaxID=2630983 RepID=UPI003CF70F2C